MVLVNNKYLLAAEDGDPTDDYSDWEQEQVMIAEQIAGETGDYIELPSKFDIHEYRIMEDFCFSLADSELGDILLSLMLFEIARQELRLRDFAAHPEHGQIIFTNLPVNELLNDRVRMVANMIGVAVGYDFTVVQHYYSVGNFVRTGHIVRNNY